MVFRQWDLQRRGTGVYALIELANNEEMSTVAFGSKVLLHTVASIYPLESCMKPVSELQDSRKLRLVMKPLNC